MGRLHPARPIFLDLANVHGYEHGLRNFSSSSVPPPLELNPNYSREESTRVQVHRQRLREQQHHAVIVAQSQKIPGVRTSAGTRILLGHAITWNPSDRCASSLLCISTHESTAERFSARESYVHASVYARIYRDTASAFSARNGSRVCSLR